MNPSQEDRDRVQAESKVKYMEEERGVMMRENARRERQHQKLLMMHAEAWAQLMEVTTERDNALARVKQLEADARGIGGTDYPCESQNAAG